jgi:hypothetical protein
MEWWHWLAAWWAGMFPTAWLCGRVERATRKSYPDLIKVGTVILWPVVAVLLPLIWAFQVGRTPPAKKDRDHGDA